jgi:hypothetical protein
MRLGFFARGHTNRVFALLRHRRVVDHQYRIAATNESVWRDVRANRFVLLEPTHWRHWDRKRV